MAALSELIQKIENPELRAQIAEAAKRALHQKQFGLVFEEHLPECTLLYDIPVKKGLKVSVRGAKANETYTVLQLADGLAACLPRDGKQAVQIPVEDLVTTAELGDPIYPSLQPLAEVCNAPECDLWHTLIEADNYHALQLLAYLYAGKVDCIYIDPPYNTGAKDWKYNNDYVDGSDEYRHSKWLSFMQKRLALAKRLLNPASSVLIVTIDEKEYLHLGCLLEEMFPEATIQMISSEVSRKGAVRYNQFTRTNEFIYFVMLGAYQILPTMEVGYTAKGEPVHWQPLRRSSIKNVRGSRPRQFYPIYVQIETGKIVQIGDYLPQDADRFSVPQIESCAAVFPVRDDGTEMLWGVTPDSCRELFKKGYLQASSYKKGKPQPFTIKYLMGGTVKDIEAGKIKITGRNPDGSIIAENLEARRTAPRTQWSFDTHDAMDYGTRIVKSIFAGTWFDFPKSLYAVRDSIRLFVGSKPDALIVDFFAGSGTTLHAVNLLNAEDGGRRRCILVTNNEISAQERSDFAARGIRPGDPEWESRGIARYVTWPRTVCSIQGRDVNGDPLKGSYQMTDGTQLPMADGFRANAVFLRLGFLDRTKVSLGMQFGALLPVLWMKAGAVGRCPEHKGPEPDLLILPENKMAILLNENCFGEFAGQLAQHPEISTIYLKTDYESSFAAMTQALEGKTTCQLYQDYLDHFRANAGRDRG